MRGLSRVGRGVRWYVVGLGEGRGIVGGVEWGGEDVVNEYVYGMVNVES